jgi:predicted alpha/beta superfamily hydrolase
MKLTILTLISAVILAGCQISTTPESQGIPEPQFVIGQLDSLHSEILDEMRYIWVHVPGEQGGAIFAPNKYPLLILLDASDHFHALTGMIKHMSENSLSPGMVVVGIPNTDRTRDMTPTHVDVAFGDSTFVRTSGGGGNFLAFIEKELIPHVEKHYPVTSYRTFVGHSLGGLTVIQALYTQPQVFSNYIAIDPSLWWDNGVMLRMSDSVLTDGDLHGKTLFLGVANTMEEGMAIDEVITDTSETTNHIRSILKFVDKAETEKSSGLSFGWKYYHDDDHGSVPLITEYDALRFLFPWYRLKGLDRFFTPESEETKEDLLDLLDSHYKQVSEHFGYEVLPEESIINSLAYGFLPTKPDFAYVLFELNIRNYPQSANVFDSMGDFYLARADTIKAIENFKKAYDMGESPFTKEKLDALSKPNQ